MRRLLLVALASTLAFAENDPEVERAVEALVERLGSPSAGERALARARLAAYGESIIPLLQQFASEDPEVTRSLRLLTAPARRMRMELVPLAKPHPIGSAIELQVLLANHTEENYSLLPPDVRRGTLSPFKAHLLRSDAPAVPFRFDEVGWGPQPEAGPVLRPGESIRVTLRIDRMSPLVRRPAVCEIAVEFRGIVRHGHGDVLQDVGDWTASPLTLTTEPVEIHVMGRKPDELEQALRARDAATREAAVLELSLRDDAAVIPLLRRHVHDRPLRLAAVRRLAALGAREDFDLVMEATRDEDLLVRRAAVLGLGNYPTVEARRRLGALAWDYELQADAIRALTGHRRAETIDLFVALLLSRNCKQDSVKEMRNVLHDWTGRVVDDRVAEVEAFRAWWETSREDWIRVNGK